jgi:small multidrug resistance family-3 protein
MLVRSVAFFLLAGLLEIGGGYLIWLTVREHRPLWLGIVGGLALAGYGVVATFQPANFGRVYAAYGGVFIVLSLAWGWAVDGHRPDRWDYLGGALCVFGMALIMYGPRAGGPGP